MSIPAVLLPLFVQVVLALGLGLWLGYLRNADLKSGKVKASQIALREPNWTVRTQQVANCFANQFELPVLFYVFVLTRLMHALVHTTSNMVQRRGAWYGFGAAALVVMWVIFMVRILFVLP